MFLMRMIMVMIMITNTMRVTMMIDGPQRHLQAGYRMKIANTDWLAHALCSCAPCSGGRIGHGATAGW